MPLTDHTLLQQLERAYEHLEDRVEGLNDDHEGDHERLNGELARIDIAIDQLSEHVAEHDRELIAVWESISGLVAEIRRLEKKGLDGQER